jgi:hypothetical protein
VHKPHPNFGGQILVKRRAAYTRANTVTSSEITDQIGIYVDTIANEYLGSSSISEIFCGVSERFAAGFTACAVVEKICGIHG